MSEPEPLTRVMALHALAYCERLFYLEEVEELRAADDAVYAGRVLHERVEPAEDGERRTFELASDRLGIRGKLDAVRRRQGSWIPYEHKRGRAKSHDGVPDVWESDRLQVGAYALLLEEHLGEPVSEGRVRYHADNVTVRVQIDDRLRSEVAAAVARAGELRKSVERPPVTEDERLCPRCSLAPVCLPEEERLAENPRHVPIRLFPADRDGQVLHVTHHAARIVRAGNAVHVKLPNDGDHRFPINKLESIVIHGHAQITTQAIHLCASHGVPVHWLSAGGRYIGGLATSVGQVQRRVRQYRALSDSMIRLELSRRLAIARVESQRRYLLRATRQLRERRSDSMQTALDQLRAALRRLPRSVSIEEVRGHEGAAGRAYFSALPLLLSGNAAAIGFSARTRRPPRDPFNALLSFGYALLYRMVLQSIVAVGLEPALGFFHTPRSAAHPLVLDLMDVFRVPIWDIPLVGSANRAHWDVTADFTTTNGQVWLSASGRQKAIELFERRLDAVWKHPVVKYSLSYGRMIELETRLLEKEWTGSPGLFARVRLR
jgi:CRISPR-associated protein Cas1